MSSKVGMLDWSFHHLSASLVPSSIPNSSLIYFDQAYHRHIVDVSSNESDSSESNSLLGCKDLAARISGTFSGTARDKHKSDIKKIVMDGIEYAFVDAPKQLSFLEVAVLHFVSKLPASDVLEL